MWSRQLPCHPELFEPAGFEHEPSCFPEARVSGGQPAVVWWLRPEEPAAKVSVGRTKDDYVAGRLPVPSAGAGRGVDSRHLALEFAFAFAL